MTREEYATFKINHRMAQIKGDLENAATIEDVIDILSRYNARIHSSYKFKKGQKHFIEGEIEFDTTSVQSEDAVFSRIHYRSRGSLFAYSYCVKANADSYKLNEHTNDLILGVF